jgi:hypothetical protein
MAESAFQAFFGRPVPGVRADDLRRVWSFLTSTQAPDTKAKQGSTTSVDLKLLADLCDPHANVLAVWFRAALIEILLREGLLDRWWEGNSLTDRVFEITASFPLPHGPEKFDLDALIAALN